MNIFVIDTETIERWLPIVGFEGFYEVSNFGNARSVDAWREWTSKSGTVHQRFCPGRPLKASPHTGGYLMLHLYCKSERTPITLHRAVMEAFVGPRPKGMEILHADDVKPNCRLSNLSYGTKDKNEADKIARGRSPKGEKNALAKLTTAQITEIRQRVGENQRDLAAEYGCTYSNISAIQLRKSWRHV